MLALDAAVRTAEENREDPWYCDWLPRIVGVRDMHLKIAQNVNWACGYALVPATVEKKVEEVDLTLLEIEQTLKQFNHLPVPAPAPAPAPAAAPTKPAPITDCTISCVTDVKTALTELIHPGNLSSSLLGQIGKNMAAAYRSIYKIEPATSQQDVYGKNYKVKVYDFSNSDLVRMLLNAARDAFTRCRSLTPANKQKLVGKVENVIVALNKQQASKTRGGR